MTRRSSDWVKLKCGERQEFVIGGYTDPKGSRTGLGSLLLGVHDEHGALRYAGNVGTGFNEQTLRELRARLGELQAQASPFATDAQLPRQAHWVNPELVCEVAFGEWTREGRIRHSVFHGIRDDKPAQAITREAPRHAAPVDRLATPARKAAAAPAPKAGKAAPPKRAVELPATLRVTNPDRVIDTVSGVGVARAIGTPDRMTFDLDPGEGVGWPQIQEAAQLVHGFLQDLGLVAFLKTSGGKGLHIVVPLKPKLDWDTVKGFSQAIVQHLARTIPQRFVAKSGGNNRVGRIFIDYLRNGLGATTVAAWSARSRPGLGISVPVRWDELAQLTSGAHWTVPTVQSRLAEGNEPWSGYEGSRNALAAAMEKLGFTVS